MFRRFVFLAWFRPDRDAGSPVPTRGCGPSTTCRSGSSRNATASSRRRSGSPGSARRRCGSTAAARARSSRADGLIMTNHHIAGDTLQKISTSAKDYYKDGFLARTRDEEVKAPDLELNVLVGHRDVTDRVNAAVADGHGRRRGRQGPTPGHGGHREGVVRPTGLRSDVVTLYRGGRYHLYTYQKYTDVRLVFAPELAIAFFGGDPDNFEFPRYDLDVAFFRAYQDGRPAQARSYLEWGEPARRRETWCSSPGNPGLDLAAEHRGPPGIPPRRRAAAEPGVAARPRGVPPGLRSSRGRGAAAVEAGPLRGPEQPEGLARPTRRPARSRPDRTQGDGRNGPSATGSRPTPAGARPMARPGTGSPGRSRSPGGSTRPFTVPRARCRLRFGAVRHRADDRAAGGGGREAQRRAAPRVRRCRPRLARAGPLLASPDLPRVRGGQARPLAGILAAHDGRVGPRPSPASSTAARPKTWPASWCAARIWPTSRSARSWCGAAGRRSRPRPTR